MTLMSRYELGRFGEDVAARFLERRGYEIIERNARIARREVDIVAKHGSLIVFVEVKTRTDERFGRGVESIDDRKRRRLIEAAAIYSRQAENVRFDAISVLVDPNRKIALKIQHIRNAFF